MHVLAGMRPACRVQAARRASKERAHVIQWRCSHYGGMPLDMSIDIFIFRTFSRRSQAISSIFTPISSSINAIRTAKELCCKSDLIKQFIEHVKSNLRSWVL